MLTILDPYVLFNIVLQTHMVSAHCAFLHCKPYVQLIKHEAQRQQVFRALFYVHINVGERESRKYVSYYFCRVENDRKNLVLPSYHILYDNEGNDFMWYLEIRYKGKLAAFNCEDEQLIYNGHAIYSSCIQPKIQKMVQVARRYPLVDDTQLGVMPRSNLDHVWGSFLHIFNLYHYYG